MATLSMVKTSQFSSFNFRKDFSLEELSELKIKKKINSEYYSENVLRVKPDDVEDISIDVLEKGFLAFLEEYYSNFSFLIHDKGARFQMLADLANMLAKTYKVYDDWGWWENPYEDLFYSLKVRFYCEAVKFSKLYWFEGETFNLYNKEVGSSSYHDPYGNIEDLLKKEGLEVPYLSIPWQGYRRQFNSDVIVNDPEVKQAYWHLTRVRRLPIGPKTRKKLNRFVELISSNPLCEGYV